MSIMLAHEPQHAQLTGSAQALFSYLMRDDRLHPVHGFPRGEEKSRLKDTGHDSTADMPDSFEGQVQPVRVLPVHHEQHRGPPPWSTVFFTNGQAETVPTVTIAVIEKISLAPMIEHGRI